jgi:hypothetical protein
MSRKYSMDESIVANALRRFSGIRLYEKRETKKGSYWKDRLQSMQQGNSFKRGCLALVLVDSSVEMANSIASLRFLLSRQTFTDLTPFV